MTYKYNGKPLTEYCKENGIKYMSIYNYLYRHDCGVEEAINAYNSSHMEREKVKYYYNGSTLAGYCKKNNIKYNNVIKHIYRGKTIEEAIEDTKKQGPIYKNGLKINSPIRYFEKYFEHPISAYIKYQSLKTKGYSKSEAMEIIKKNYSAKYTNNE